MLFDALIPTCYYPGSKISDGDLGVRVKTLHDEKVLFFNIDDKSENPPSVLPLFRNMFGYKGKLCDALAYYYKCDINPAYLANKGEYHKNCRNKKPISVVCLLEFKESHLDDAVEQIIETYIFIKDKYSKKRCAQFDEPQKYKAFISYGGSAPQDTIDYYEKLKQYFSIEDCDIYRDESGEADISIFLRKNIEQ